MSEQQAVNKQAKKINNNNNDNILKMLARKTTLQGWIGMQWWHYRVEDVKVEGIVSVPPKI